MLPPTALRWAPGLNASAGLLGLVLCACDRVAESATSFVREDSAGVVITTSFGEGWAPDDAWSVAAEPSLSMGGSAPGEELFGVSDYVRAPDGSMIILASRSSEIHVFNANGESVRLIGRAGPGPGEYMTPRSIALAASDTLLVLDRDAIEIFLLDGSWVESVPLIVVPNPFGLGTGTVPAAVAPDRSILAYARRARTGPPVGLYRPDEGRAVFPAPDQPPVLLGWYGGIEQERIDVGGMTRSIVSPFARFTVSTVGVSRDARFVVADNARYEIQLFDALGTLRHIIRRDTDPVPVQRQWIEDWKEAQRSMEWTQGQLPALERGWAQMTVNETLPAFEWVVFDSEGCLWVLRSSGEQDAPSMADVFDPAGRFLGPVRIPSGLRTRPAPLIGTDYLMGVWTDELDVESVRVYRLQRGG